MNKLTVELQRLYLPAASPGAADEAGLVGAQGEVRALVIGLGGPAPWAALSALWQGVQADLGWPAPAIAVSGQDACQLWLSLAQPVPVAQAQAVLQALRQRYLAAVPAQRLQLLPRADAAAPQRVLHAARVPALQADGERWSAFVSPDLVPVFAESPWLDLPPNLDGQAGLLAPLKSLSPDALQRALATGATPPPAGSHAGPAGADARPGPGQFLRDVMNNEAVDLALRIEAAKALLPYHETPR